MNETEANAMARELVEPFGLSGLATTAHPYSNPLEADLIDSVAALILSVDARARQLSEAGERLCECAHARIYELENGVCMFDEEDHESNWDEASKAWEALRAGGTTLAVNEGES